MEQKNRVYITRINVVNSEGNDESRDNEKALLFFSIYSI